MNPTKDEGLHRRRTLLLRLLAIARMIGVHQKEEIHSCQTRLS
jgi:hypothetical protein